MNGFTAAGGLTLAVVAGVALGSVLNPPGVPGYLLEVGASVCEHNHGMLEARPSTRFSKTVTFQCKNGAHFYDIPVHVEAPSPLIPTKSVIGKDAAGKEGES